MSGYYGVYCLMFYPFQCILKSDVARLLYLFYDAFYPDPCSRDSWRVVSRATSAYANVDALNLGQTLQIPSARTFSIR